MDRTNWQFGRTHVNILVVSVLLGRVGLPVAWLVLPLGIEELQGRRIKNHGYRAKSLFRLGFESLHTMIHKPLRWAQRLREFLEVIVRRPLAENFVV